MKEGIDWSNVPAEERLTLIIERLRPIARIYDKYNVIALGSLDTSALEIQMELLLALIPEIERKGPWQP